MLKVLERENSILNRFVAELRDHNVQTDRMRFRRNLTAVGEIMAYEISKTLNYNDVRVESPLGVCTMKLSEEPIVLASILRSGLPFHEGFLNIFREADSSFISAYRHYHKDGKYTIDMDYVATSAIAGKTLIIIDPLLATGASALRAYEALAENGDGEPARVIFASIVATQSGIDHIVKHSHTHEPEIFTASIDPELTVKSYIVPGIGDVGDLAYGDKI